MAYEGRPPPTHDELRAALAAVRRERRERRLTRSDPAVVVQVAAPSAPREPWPAARKVTAALGLIAALVAAGYGAARAVLDLAGR